jgi:hypothetical protein
MNAERALLLTLEGTDVSIRAFGPVTVAAATHPGPSMEL